MEEEQNLISVLRDKGVQVTYQRLAIYQVLHQEKKHLNAETIYKEVKKRFPMISLGTVYKTLERFYEAGLIRRVAFVDESTRYEARLDPHHHLLCLKCQSIQDLDGPAVIPGISLPNESGFQVLRQQAIFEGYCASCK
jgi:Fur family peroxide stress response transcriptional regulator